MDNNYIVIEEDLALMSGRPMMFEEMEIKPFTLRNISIIGYVEFNNIIASICMKLDDILDGITDFEVQAKLKSRKHELNVLDLHLEIESLSKMLIHSLQLLLRTSDIKIVQDEYDYKSLLVDGEHSINRRNFKELAYIVNLQNMPKQTSIGEEEFNLPEGSKARELAERMREQANKVEKLKQQDNDSKPMYLPDVISAVTAMSYGINKFNVWDLTLYQLYDEFARLKQIDLYKLGMQASLHVPDIEVIPWSEPI